MSCTPTNVTYTSLTHFCLLWPWLMKISHTPNSKSHVSFLFLRSFQRIFPSLRSCVTFCNILVLQSEELLHPLPSPQAGEPPFVGYPILIQSYLPHLAAIFSNHDLRTCHVPVTQTHYHGQWWNVWIRAIRSSLKILRYQPGHQDICSWAVKQATALWLHLNNFNRKGFKCSQAWNLTIRLLQQLENSRAGQDEESTDLKTDQ